jgi:hypothetical protein
MNKYKVLLVLLFFAGNVQAKEDKEAYQDCVLQYVAGTEDPSAASMLTYACNQLYVDNFMLSEKDTNYNQCLLDYLPDSKKRAVSMKIKQTCNEKHRSFFK